MTDIDDWGCEYCRNDGELSDVGVCPKCDAQYTDETGGRPNPMTDILELAKRVEALDGPDRVVDVLIGVAVRHVESSRPDWLRNWAGDFAPMPKMTGRIAAMNSKGNPAVHWEALNCTASLDAAMTLVPEGWIVVHLSELGGAGGCICKLGNPGTSQDALSDSGARTMPLALVAAALRAKEATNG